MTGATITALAHATAASPHSLTGTRSASPHSLTSQRPLTAAPSLRFKHWCLGANNATAALATGLLTNTEHWGNIEHWQFCGNTERWGNIEQ